MWDMIWEINKGAHLKFECTFSDILVLKTLFRGIHCRMLQIVGEL